MRPQMELILAADDQLNSLLDVNMSATMRKENEDDSEAKYIGDNLKTCMICIKERSKYTCPRCNVQYCSLTCYRDQKHEGCSEAFYKDWVVDELSHSSASNEDKEKIMEILQREQAARDEADESEDDSEGIPELQERLQGLDLDENAGEVWSRLTDKEKEEFSQMLEDGRLSNLVEVWTPWWTNTETLVEEVSDQNEHAGKERPKLLADIPDIHQLLPKNKPSSDLRFSLVNVLYSYAFVTRLHNGGHHDCPSVSSQVLSRDLLGVCGVLGEGRNCTSTGEAVHLCFHTIQQNPARWNVTPEMTVSILEDIEHLLNGPGNVSPLSYILSAISDITRLIRAAIKDCQKELKSSVAGKTDLKLVKKKLFLAEKKSVFLLSWAQRYGMATRDLIPELRIEKELQAVNVTSVSKTKKAFESHWGGKVPQAKKSLIQEIT